MANDDRVGVSHRAALRQFYDAGFNDPIALENALVAIYAMPQATQGYVYADDIPAAIENLKEAVL